jgi:hypothetical protein
MTLGAQCPASARCGAWDVGEERAGPVAEAPREQSSTVANVSRQSRHRRNDQKCIPRPSVATKTANTIIDEAIVFQPRPMIADPGIPAEGWSCRGMNNSGNEAAPISMNASVKSAEPRPK